MDKLIEVFKRSTNDQQTYENVFSSFSHKENANPNITEIHSPQSEWLSPGNMVGRDLKDHSSRPHWAKKLVRSPSQPIKLGGVACICHPKHMGRINRRIIVQTSPGINSRPYLKNNQQD
jgi:hypothetical protein